MSGRVLVTGAAGNVGSEVVRGLLGRGERVLAAVIGEHEYARVAEGAERVVFDFTDAGTFGAALDGVDRVFLMRPPHMADASAFDAFLATAREAGVRQMVFLSLLGAERNPVVPHHAIEKRLRASGLAWTMLRPSFFMQNLSTTHLRDIRDRGEIIVPAGSGKTSFIDVRDIAAAAVAVLTEPGHELQAYALTGAEALTYDQCAEMLSRATGRAITYTRPSGRAFSRHMRELGYPKDFIAVTRAIYFVARIGMAGTLSSQLAALIGRAPISFGQFAEDHAALFSPPSADHAHSPTRNGEAS